MKTKLVDIASLSLDPANLRRHPERNMQAIMGSLRRFGQQKPIVVDAKGVVIAGNGTLAAAKQLGWKQIAVVETALAGSDATAFAIADNRAAELAEWDDDALAKTLAALQIEEEELAVSTGFMAQEINAMTERYIESQKAPESSTKEIDVDDFQMQCRCPRCGFEFDPKT
jgi:ParB-like chromosome segregation protein Spo0J